MVCIGMTSVATFQQSHLLPWKLARCLGLPRARRGAPTASVGTWQIRSHAETVRVGFSYV